MAGGAKAWIGWGLVLALGWVAGWYSAQRPPARASATPPDDEWIARIGDRYIDDRDIVAEMRRRGGERPGLFQDAAARRALLDDMLLHQVLVDAARDAGLDQEPETRRVIEQLLIGRYVEGNLHRTQRALQVGSDEVARYYAEHAGDYAVPARRRVAMLRIDVARGAAEEAWTAAEARAAEAVRRTRALQPAVPDFGPLAVEYSSDQASRYRGGSLGWLTDLRRDSYSFDPALRDLAFALTAPGEFSDVVRGADAVYVARLVELQPAKPRPLTELRAGIEQMLLQQRQEAAEKQFREDTLAAADIEVREARLDAIAPLGPPAPTEPTPPPAVPGVEESAP
jgi:PPIC-type PPIASE domain